MEILYADRKNAFHHQVMENVAEIAVGARTDVGDIYLDKILLQKKFYGDISLSTGGGGCLSRVSERGNGGFHTLHGCNSGASSPSPCTTCAQDRRRFPLIPGALSPTPVDDTLSRVGPPRHASPKDTDMSRPPTAIHVVRQHHAEPGALPTGERTPTDVPPTVPARAHNAPDAFCPTCGLQGEGIGPREEAGVCEANYLCPAGHIWLTSWPAGPPASPPERRAS